MTEVGCYVRDLMSRARRAIVTLNRPHDIRDFPLAVNLYEVRRVNPAMRELAVDQEFVLAPNDGNGTSDHDDGIAGPSLNIVLAVWGEYR